MPVNRSGRQKSAQSTPPDARTRANNRSLAVCWTTTTVTSTSTASAVPCLGAGQGPILHGWGEFCETCEPTSDFVCGGHSFRQALTTGYRWRTTVELLSRTRCNPSFLARRSPEACEAVPEPGFVVEPIRSVSLVGRLRPARVAAPQEVTINLRRQLCSSRFATSGRHRNATLRISLTVSHDVGVSCHGRAAVPAGRGLFRR